MGKPIISFDQVVKRYDDETVLKVSFEIEQGKFIHCLVLPAVVKQRSYVL